MSDDISARVKKIVVEHLGVDEDKVTDGASFIDDLGADSLDTVELVMAFEEEFGCEIPDDAAENFLNWPILHALGSNDIVLDLYKKAWDGHLLQYTEAKTVEVPMGRDGMYFKEFPVMFDWMHHGEWLNAFVLQGLSDPKDPNYIRRVKTYSGFYMGEDPIAENWDDKLGIIKSMFNGSRGPLLRKATGLDWAGDDIELAGRFKPNHKETSYEMMVEHFDPYTDVAGDHPLNLSATVLALNAFALTG